jgi:hypothetical protein
MVTPSSSFKVIVETESHSWYDAKVDEKKSDEEAKKQHRKGLTE